MNTQIESKKATSSHMKKEISKLMKQEKKNHELLFAYLENKAKIVRSVWQKCQPHAPYWNYGVYRWDEKTTHPVAPPDVKWAYDLKKSYKISVYADGFILHMKNGRDLLVENKFIAGSDRDIAKRVRRNANWTKYNLLLKIRSFYRARYTQELSEGMKHAFTYRVENDNDQSLQNLLDQESRIKKESKYYNKYVQISRQTQETEKIVYGKN